MDSKFHFWVSYSFNLVQRLLCKSKNTSVLPHLYFVVCWITACEELTDIWLLSMDNVQFKPISLVFSICPFISVRVVPISCELCGWAHFPVLDWALSWFKLHCQCWSFITCLLIHHKAYIEKYWSHVTHAIMFEFRCCASYSSSLKSQPCNLFPFYTIYLNSSVIKREKQRFVVPDCSWLTKMETTNIKNVFSSMYKDDLLYTQQVW